MVVFSKNPINSVLFLIFSFINTAGIFLIAGAEFLALILVIVYVGAVAVLFLFVIMMLDLDENQLKGEIKKYYKSKDRKVYRNFSKLIRKPFNSSLNTKIP